MSVEANVAEASSVTTEFNTVCTYASGRRLTQFNRVLPGDDRRGSRRRNTIIQVRKGIPCFVSLFFYYYKITLERY
jgi:hypothetical protein